MPGRAVLGCPLGVPGCLVVRFGHFFDPKLTLGALLGGFCLVHGTIWVQSGFIPGSFRVQSGFNSAAWLPWEPVWGSMRLFVACFVIGRYPQGAPAAFALHCTLQCLYRLGLCLCGLPPATLRGRRFRTLSLTRARIYSCMSLSFVETAAKIYRLVRWY